MRKVVALLLLLAAIPLAYASLSCTITNSTCTNTDIYHISDATNAHAEQNNESNYDYIVCCNETNNVTINTTCNLPESTTVINLSSSTNAHVEKPDQTNYGFPVCITPEKGTITCTYQTTPCAQACLGAIFGDTNAHVENCTSANYNTFICCDYTAPGTGEDTGGGGGSSGPTTTYDVRAGLTKQEDTVPPERFLTNLGEITITPGLMLAIIVLLGMLILTANKATKVLEIPKRIIFGKKEEEDGT